MEPISFRWETNADVGIRFELPTTWTVTRTDDTTIVAESPDGHVGLEFMFVKRGAAEIPTDEKLLINHLKGLVSDFEITNPPHKLAQHGLDGFGVGGKGQRKGRSVEWFSMAFGNHRGHGLLAMGHAPAGDFAANAPTLTRIMNSIQPAS